MCFREKIINFLIVSVLFASVGFAIAPAWATIDLVPLQDTFDDSFNPLANFGTNPGLRINNVTGKRTGTNRTYFQFPVETLPSDLTGEDVIKAYLWIFVNKVGVDGVLELLKIVTDLDDCPGGWSEETLTFDSAPCTTVVGSVMASISFEDVGHWVPIDVTPIVRDWVDFNDSNRGFALVPYSDGNNEIDITIDSKENPQTSHPAILSILLGSVGPVGPQGEQGKLGPQGEQGKLGPQGEQGEQGKLGPQGEQGKLGQQGEQGKIGPQGEQGKLGPQGEQGKIGPQGEQGKLGPQGEQGKIGPQGEQGKLGPQGEQGKLGPQGEQGKLGPQGEQGKLGPQGEQGKLGPQGEQGKLGPQGEQGKQGPPGADGLNADPAAIVLLKEAVLTLRTLVDAQSLERFADLYCIDNATGQLVPEGEACDDLNDLTINDTCDADGHCRGEFVEPSCDCPSFVERLTVIENCESPDGLFPETWPYDTSTAWQVVNYTDSGPESINAQFTNDPNYDPNIKDSDVVDFFTYPITEDGPQCLSKVGNQDVAELEPSQALLQCADLVREIVDTLDCAN